MTQQALISFQGLGRSFHGRGGQGVVRAVRDISLDIAAGDTLGVVGESGCGKSTLGRMAVGLLEPSAGDVFFKGLPLYEEKAHADYKAFRRGLAGTIQMIFQDPYSSLNPRMSIGESVAEPLICARTGLRGNGGGTGNSRAAVRERVETMLRQVGLEADAARRYPHEFSGGQRQRIAIARALVTSPDFVVCDEPTSSLDASVQSQVLNLLRDMQRELSLTYMFISHDLAVVRHMSDRVAVMYRGLLVEMGGSEDVFASPFHPYTQLLLESVPGVDSDGGRKEPMDDGAPASSGPLSESSSGPTGTAFVSQADMREILSLLGREGCPFAPRCPYVKASCRTALPELVVADRPASALCRDRAGCPEEGQERRTGMEEHVRPDERQQRDASRLVRCRLYEGGASSV